METQNPPFKIARTADERTGPTCCDNGLKMKFSGSIRGEGSHPSELGLSLEFGRGSGHQIGCPKSTAFTFLQLQELEHQALIYNYMEAGLPVPSHLILPIWKSVARSLSGLNSGIYKHYPYLLGCSPLCFDYRESMDPEPGRCRRTDGKKWRCSKDVAPNQKYCERHMHRGRQRSRKHVESSQLSTTTCTGNINTTNSNVQNSDTSLSISPPASSNSSLSSPRLGFYSKSNVVIHEDAHKSEFPL